MAAKAIKISDDGGSNYFTLPGGTGEFSPEGEAIDDTIFGHTYRSQLTGLIGWNVSANALYKGFAGYQAKLLQNGTSTAATGEAMSQDSGQIYSIDDATKEIWDRDTAITVYDGTTDVTAQVEWYDYLFGRLKFDDGYTVVGSITIDVNYFPTSVFGKGNSYTLTMTADTIDKSTFADAQSNGGFRNFDPGLRTVELELDGIFDASVNAKDILKQRNEIIIEIDPAGDGKSISRGFFRVTNAPQSGDVGALEEQSVGFTLNVPDDELLQRAFGWRHANDTTLSTAVQKIIDAFVNETKPKIQYLPEGTTGNSPLDGVEGDVVMTDISLSGGLSDMNTFNAEMQGDGAWTEV